MMIKYKKIKWILPILLMATVSYSQERDSLAISKQKRDSLKTKITRVSLRPTKAPLLGGFNLGVIITPMETDDDNFTVQQYSLEIASPIYGSKKSKHPYFGKVSLKYEQMRLSENQIIDHTDFHNLRMLFSHSIILPKRKILTFIGSAGIGSDFKEGIKGEDIYFHTGVRMGWLNNKKFIYGVSLMYVNTYVGQFILPIPDFYWQIDERWSLNGLLPVKTSLDYTLSQSASIGLAINLNTSNYRLHEEENKDQFIQFFQYNGGLNYEKIVKERWKFSVFAGYTLMQRFQTFDNDKKVGINDFKALQEEDRANISYDKEKSPVFQFGFSYLF